MRTLRRAKALASVATFALVAAMLVPLFSTPALAQATAGSIRGTVSDQAGAVVTGATVTAKNEATGVTTVPFRATGEGIYVIPNLNPGKYTITVEAQGFKKGEFTNVTVSIGQDTTLDVALVAGIASETVTVTAGTEEVVNRESAQVSANFESRKVAELPSNAAGGGIDTLALLAPGVVPGLAGNSNGTTLSVNGNRSRSNNFTIDGQDNNDLSVAGPSFFVDNQDAIEEFQVITNNFSAQYGRNQGAIVNIVTKSGTNEFHGTGFWFHRDRKILDSLTNLERRSGDFEEAAPLLSNIYGGTIGGPVIKDRAFFFGSYQGIKIRESFTAFGTGLALLPSEFDRIKQDNPGNPAVAILADFGAFALNDFGSVTPRSDLGESVFTLNGRNYRAAFPQRTFSLPFDQEEFTLRGDVKLTDKDTIWSSYLYQDSSNKNSLGASNGFTGDIIATSKKYGLTWNRQVSNRAVNSFFFSYGSIVVDFGGGCEGLKGCIPAPADILGTFPTVNFSGLRSSAGTAGAFQTVGGASNLPQGRFVRTYQFSDTFQWTKGRHQLSFGADIKRLNNDTTVIFDFGGTFTSWTAARLLANSPGVVTFAAGEPTLTFNETDQYYFVQDDWKIRDNITLNLGLRYEYTGQPVNALHELTLARESSADAFWRQSLPIEARIVPKIDGDKNNFAPRLGFAWTPRSSGDGWMGKLLGEDATVIRGGYGIAYEPAFYNILIFLSTATPVVFNNQVQNPAAAALLGIPDSTPTAGEVQELAASRSLIARNVLDPRLLSQSALPADFHAPYSQQWSFGIQRQLNRTNVFEIRYLGTHGVSLFQNRDANPRIDRLVNGFSANVGGQTINFPGFPNLVPSGITPVTCTNNPATPDNEGACQGRILPGRGIVTETGNHGQSIYHSLQTRYNGRLFNQLTLGSSYTWSKALDTSSEVIGLTSAGSLSQAAFDIVDSERGYSGFDRRHVYSLSGIWDIPAFKDQKGFLGKAFGGWQVNSVYFIASGRRYTVGQVFNNALNALGIPVYSHQPTADRARPFYGNINAPRDTVAITGIDAILGAGFYGWPTNGVARTTQLYSLNDLNNGIVRTTTADANRFIINGPGSAILFNNPYGDVLRNSEVAPRINQLNAGFFKNTRINERFNIQFRTEIFNILNHPQPGYGTTFGGGTFPDRFATDAGLADGFNDFGGIEYARRVIQFGLRVVF